MILPDDEDVKAIWRVGLLAYRAARRRDPTTTRDCAAGRDAILAAYPHISPDAANQHVINAVAWASIHHNDWLQRGVPRREWIWPPDHRGVGHHRNPGYEDS